LIYIKASDVNTIWICNCGSWRVVHLRYATFVGRGRVELHVRSQVIAIKQRSPRIK
jgi:hypothetical protein